jgi:hypothetical protein
MTGDEAEPGAVRVGPFGTVSRVCDGVEGAYSAAWTI